MKSEFRKLMVDKWNVRDIKTNHIELMDDDETFYFIGNDFYIYNIYTTDKETAEWIADVLAKNPNKKLMIPDEK